MVYTLSHEAEAARLLCILHTANTQARNADTCLDYAIMLAADGEQIQRSLLLC